MGGGCEIGGREAGKEREQPERGREGQSPRSEQPREPKGGPPCKLALCILRLSRGQRGLRQCLQRLHGLCVCASIACVRVRVCGLPTLPWRAS